MTEFDGTTSILQATGQAAREARTAQAEAELARAQAEQARAMADQVRENVRAAVEGAGQGRASRVEVTEAPGGRQIIRVPDGRGGTQEIVVGPKGVTIDGEGVAAVDFRNAVPTGVVDMVQTAGATLAICVVGFPLARAFGRWLDRRGASPKVPPEVMARLSSIENAVETVAVEVERISEGQRFTTKLLNERASRDLQDPLAIGDRR